MWVADTVRDIRDRRGQLRGTVALVPTMGAMHAGHVALIESARRLADHTIVSLFVNPTQFGPDEDLEHYPQPLEQDLAACRRSGVRGVFHPTTDQVYPPGLTACRIDVPTLSGQLEAEHRPGHFQGVCRVVAKLLNIVQPDVACFGLKDYQQLRIVEAMVLDLQIPTRIVEVPTVRESDGLALSSRNVYLDTQQRHQATALYRALREAQAMVEQAGKTDPTIVEQAMQRTMTADGIHVDYAVVRHPQTMVPLAQIAPGPAGGCVALVAGRVGTTRLIDNMLIGGSPPLQPAIGQPLVERPTERP